MSQVSDRDVVAIKNWIAKEPYMPKTFDDLTIKKFLYSCHCSLERTKKCLEEFCTRRTNMPEIYTNRDPLSKSLQLVFSYTTLTSFMAGVDEILIHQITDVPSNFDFYDFLKAFTIVADNWINYKLDTLPENQIAIVDIKYYTLSLVAKMNVFFVQKFIIYLLESMPVRLKQVHVINCPSFYEYLYNLVKPAIPENFRKLIHFHPDHMSLHKFIDKKYLPKDYDGESLSIAEQDAFWVGDVCDKRKCFLDDNYWKADLSKKPKNDNCLSGSFRTLAID